MTRVWTSTTLEKRDERPLHAIGRVTRVACASGSGALGMIRESIGAHRCPSCGRLSVWWDGWDAEPTVYAPERR